MPDQAQIGAQRPADMIALPTFTAHHAALNATKLLDVAMIRFDRPNLARGGGADLHRHQLVISGPVFRVTVWGVDPKHQDEAVAFEMYARATVANVALLQRTIATSIGVDQPIGLQARQPAPLECSEILQVLQTAVPTIKAHILGRKPTLVCNLQHGTKMVVFGQSVVGCIKQAIIAWDSVRAVTPHE